MYRDQHPAIVSVEKFEAVQTLIENRKHHVHGTLPSLHVIDEGIFRGYIPINHHWINDDPNVYYDISNSVTKVLKVKKIDKRSLSAFNLEGYQVVRNQFTQVRYEGPSVTFADSRVKRKRRLKNDGDIYFLLYEGEPHTYFCRRPSWYGRTIEDLFHDIGERRESAHNSLR